MSSEKKAVNVEVYTIPNHKSLMERQTEKQKKFWHIDKEMLRFKLHYFLFNGAFGICLPYLTIFAQVRVGLSSSAIAAILTSQRCILIFTKVAIGYIADYFNKLKATICILLLITTVFLFLLLAVPGIENVPEEAAAVQVDSTSYSLVNNSEISVSCKSEAKASVPSTKNIHLNESINSSFYLSAYAQFSSFFKSCFGNKKNISENTSNDYDDIVLKQLINDGNLLQIPYSCELCCKITGECQTVIFKSPINYTKNVPIESIHISNFQTYQFWLFAFLSTIGTACTNGLFTITDTACCECVQKTGAEFGRQRIWGAVGWGLLSPIGGLLNDYTGDFVASWILMAAMTFISLLNLKTLDMEKPEIMEKSQLSGNLLKDIGKVLASKKFFVFTLCVLLNGVGTGVMWFYHVLFLTDIGASRFLVGMVMFVQSFVGGIPMFFSGWVIKRIGHYNVLILSLVAYCIRFFWYSNLYNPWLVLPVEVLHGLTFGLFYTNLASFAKLSAKPGTEATTQAILFTVHEGVGVGFGCIAAGIGFDTVGGRVTMLYLSIFSGCGIILSIIWDFLVRQEKGSITVTSKS